MTTSSPSAREIRPSTALAARPQQQQQQGLQVEHAMEAITAQVHQNIEPYPTNDFVHRELIRQGSHETLSG